MGDIYKRPLKFENTSIIINWSFYELKLEIDGGENDVEIITEFYDCFSKYGEWGEDFIKPIVWMEIYKDQNYLKSKKLIDSKEVSNFLKKSKKFKIIIYFETIINESPFEEDFFSSNSYWIDCIGGLYYIVDLNLYIEKDEKIYEGELHTGAENYRYENLKEYAIETAKTSKELIKINAHSRFEIKKSDL